MTDNGFCYKSFCFQQRPCKRLGLKHIRTKPCTPKTNGKADRFVQTSLHEWAYARATTLQKNEPPSCRDDFTAQWHRPHGSIGSMPPISRLALTRNNL
jgi:transposase InsO family protein